MDSLDSGCNSFYSCHGFAVQLVDSFTALFLGMILQRFVLVLNALVSNLN